MTIDVDIGICWLGPNRQVACLDEDDRNYCCDKLSILLMENATETSICCTYEQYTDEHWVSLAVVQGYYLFLIVFFVGTTSWLGWIFVTSLMIDEKDVKLSRRLILKRLLKNQILHKSRVTDPSAVKSMDRIHNSLMSSITGSRKKKSPNAKKAKPNDALHGKRIQVNKSPKVTRFKEG